MSFIEWFETDICGTSLEGHNVNFTTGRFLHVLGTSLKKFYANVVFEVFEAKVFEECFVEFCKIFPSMSFLIYVQCFTYRQYRKKAI